MNLEDFCQSLEQELNNKGFDCHVIYGNEGLSKESISITIEFFNYEEIGIKRFLLFDIPKNILDADINKFSDNLINALFLGNKKE